MQTRSQPLTQMFHCDVLIYLICYIFTQPLTYCFIPYKHHCHVGQQDVSI